MKKKAVIYGSTNTGRRIYDAIKDEVNVIGYLDEDSEKWGVKHREEKFIRLKN